jgi:hypothetical protein
VLGPQTAGAGKDRRKGKINKSCWFQLTRSLQNARELWVGAAGLETHLVAAEGENVKPLAPIFFI